MIDRLLFVDPCSIQSDSLFALPHANNRPSSACASVAGVQTVLPYDRQHKNHAIK